MDTWRWIPGPIYLAVFVCLQLPAASAQETWRLPTKWTAVAAVDHPLAEYPRPQMVRSNWQNLNGMWDYAITDQSLEAPPATMDGQIRVPFAVESDLSGVGRRVGGRNALWYRRSFEVPADWHGEKLLLNFGAVDWDAQFWVNGQQVGDHQGGYDPFSFEISEQLRSSGPQELVVRVTDPIDRSYQPRGKQVRRPRGIWYTPVTGIWQTVWLEPVPEQYIDRLRITPDVDQSQVNIEVSVAGTGAAASGLEVEALVETDTELARTRVPAGEPLAIRIPDPELWSPDKPHLYNISVKLIGGQETVDTVESYFGMRKIELKNDAEGIQRLLLNGEAVFQFGPLDQGWWPDGLYTAPTDEALRYDIEVTKQLGYNMCRKHVKVEPARWYYWCDKLGLMVWQDMPSGDDYIGGNDPDYDRSDESEATYRREYQAMVNYLYNHPSIVAWVPFNEGWGQFKTNEILAWAAELDPTRLIDGPSGWADRGGGHMHDMHSYPGPGMFPTESDRASVLGEFGGLGLPTEGHLWQDRDNWGYRTFETTEALAERYGRLIDQLWLLKGKGLAAAVYTQTTDVEGEVNGLMTYDRHVVKFDIPATRAVNRQLYQAPPTVRPLVVTAQESDNNQWAYTTSKPEGAWQQPGYDDTAWKTGMAGFGNPDTPGTAVRTEWRSDDIWLRRTVDVSGADGGELYWNIHHDEDVDIYVDGQQVASLEGYTTSYSLVDMTEEARAALTPGRHVIAVHCHQTGGGQYIDVGLSIIEPQE